LKIEDEVLASGNLISSQESLNMDGCDDLSPEIFVSKSEVKEYDPSESQLMIQRGPSSQIFPSFEDDVLIVNDDAPPPIDEIDLTGIDDSLLKEGSEKKTNVVISLANETTRFHFVDTPPSRSEMEAWMLREKIKPCFYLDPFYSDPKDKTRPMIYAGREFRIPVLNEERLKAVRLVSNEGSSDENGSTIFENR
jgi:hypothetical protein